MRRRQLGEQRRSNAVVRPQGFKQPPGDFETLMPANESFRYPNRTWMLLPPLCATLVCMARLRTWPAPDAAQSDDGRQRVGRFERPDPFAPPPLVVRVAREPREYRGVKHETESLGWVRVPNGRAPLTRFGALKASLPAPVSSPICWEVGKGGRVGRAKRPKAEQGAEDAKR